MPQLGLANTAVSPSGAPSNPAQLTVEALYRAHAKAVARWAIRLLGPDADYEDVVHEVFLVVRRRLSEFRGEAAVTTWLYEITVRVVQTARKRARWWAWLTGRAQKPGRGHARALVPPAPTSWDPQMHLEARERSRLIYQLLDELGEEQRTVLILFELEGLSGNQIAALTGTNVNTVWVRLSRARHRFLRRMRAWEAREEP